MGCTQGISAAITNDCATNLPTTGAKVAITVFERGNITTIAYAVGSTRIVEDITLSNPAFLITGHKKSTNAGHDLVVSENAPDMFTQYLSIQQWGITAADIKALDELGDIVVVVENKNSGVAGDGAYEIYGLETGLFKSSDTRRVNDNLGVGTIELTNQEGEAASFSRHTFFKTDYAATKVLVDALLV